MNRFSFILLLSIFYSSMHTTAFSRDFVIMANPQEPYKFQENGIIQGIDIEIVDIVMKKLNIAYVIKFIKSDARIQQEAQKGRADMLLLFSKRKSREEYLLYPEESYVNITWNFFIRAEDENKITFDTFDDLKGLTIGATNDISYTPAFFDANLRLEMAPRNDLQIGKLLKNRLDAVPMNTISTLYEEKKKGNLEKITFLPKPLKSKPYYNVFSKASTYPNIREIHRKYNQIIKELKADGTIQNIFEKYLSKQINIPNS